MTARLCPMTVSHVAGAGIVYIRCAHRLLDREVICACCMDRDYDHAGRGVCSSRGERLAQPSCQRCGHQRIDHPFAGHCERRVCSCPAYEPGVVSEKPDAVAGSGEHAREQGAREAETAKLGDFAVGGKPVDQSASNGEEHGNQSDHGAPPAGKLNRKARRAQGIR